MFFSSFLFFLGALRGTLRGVGFVGNAPEPQKVAETEEGKGVSVKHVLENLTGAGALPQEQAPQDKPETKDHAVSDAVLGLGLSILQKTLGATADSGKAEDKPAESGQAEAATDAEQPLKRKRSPSMGEDLGEEGDQAPSCVLCNKKCEVHRREPQFRGGKVISWRCKQCAWQGLKGQALFSTLPHQKSSQVSKQAKQAKQERVAKAAEAVNPEADAAAAQKGPKDAQAPPEPEGETQGQMPVVAATPPPPDPPAADAPPGEPAGPDVSMAEAPAEKIDLPPSDPPLL